MKCQNQFSGKSKKNVTNLLSAELAKRVVKVKGDNLCDFLFTLLHTDPLLKRCLPMGNKFFSVRVDPF